MKFKFHAAEIASSMIPNIEEHPSMAVIITLTRVFKVRLGNEKQVRET
jgi:hypothetical protein